MKMNNLLYNIYILFFLLFSMNVNAQKNRSNNLHYSWQVQNGIVAGSSDITFMAQTIQGIEKNNWFTGLGVGYDNYGIAGIPVVLHGQKSFTEKRNKPFLYAQSGIQIPIKTGQWNDKGWNGTAEYNLHTGYIGEMGAGYTFLLNKAKKIALILNAGYSYKYNQATYKQLNWPIYLSSLPSEGFDEFMIEHQTYHYRRIILKIGFKF